MSSLLNPVRRTVAVLCAESSGASKVASRRVLLMEPGDRRVLDRDLVGSLDLLERDRDGRLVVVDLKTSSRKPVPPAAGRGAESLAPRLIVNPPPVRSNSLHSARVSKLAPTRTFDAPDIKLHPHDPMFNGSRSHAGSWADYRAAQRARRHVRRRERWERLTDRLPPRGVAVEQLTQTAARLEGYGYAVIYDPTHNTAHVAGESDTRVMTPEQVAAEFRWRWKREGCP